MSKQTLLGKPIYSLLPMDVEGFDFLSCTAYSIMDSMLSEALPIYSGWIGNLGGDSPGLLTRPSRLIFISCSWLTRRLIS